MFAISIVRIVTGSTIMRFLVTNDGKTTKNNIKNGLKSSTLALLVYSVENLCSIQNFQFG